MTDIEISKQVLPARISDIAEKMGIDNKYIEYYGNNKAKISLDIFEYLEEKENGKLVLVTSTNPTPYGEGKTTVSIGINDALCLLGKKSIVTLREPSLGPVFGIKGGATGGGYAQVIPMEDINLHFTGDIHAIESCNNLLSAIIDNHIYQGNELNLDLSTVCFNRCVDLNDRALRNIILKYDNKGLEREEHYNITVASEIMAILCLTKDIEDLKNRLGNILVGYTKNNESIFVKDLHCEGALALLLKDAIKPNLVQTLEHNPAIIHGGPFANIAHGCNSLLATKLALKLGDYVITEAGFGSDLGAEKFLDIKCQVGNIKPNAIVINTSIRSIKYNGGASKEEISTPNLGLLEKGICNLEAHINNMKKYTSNLLICINKFPTDTEEEINYVKDFVLNKGYVAEVCTSYQEGGKGAISIAEKLIELCAKKVDYQPLYNFKESIIDKINKVCTQIYHAGNVVISKEIKEKIDQIEKIGFGHLPICIAKTQYSFSNNAKILGNPIDHEMTITDVKLSSGAGFIVVCMGNIMTMPGLGKSSAYLSMDIDNNGNITGLY